jgi:hypothetical protein
LQPVARPIVPTPRRRDWANGPVDRFLLARLERAGLPPAPQAEPTVLARRLAFVLTGLPPSVDDLDRFLNDRDPNAYERLVDRLLAAPQFGERWARHWMDVVRYGDTYGYEWDIPAKGAWRYRDYLVRAFNTNVPFDQLVREQIAGDLLPEPRLNRSEQINESLAGPMFFQLGEKRHGDSAMFDGIHQEMLHNKIDAFSKAFQGLTIGCARCHDHKLDAVSQRVIIALAGALMSPRWVSRTLDTPERNAEVLAELRSLKRPLREALASWWIDRLSPPSEGKATPPFPEAAWQKAITAAGEKPAWEHPLRPWIEVMKGPGDGEPLANAWTKLGASYHEEGRRRADLNRKKFRVLADFRAGVPQGWSVEGVGFNGGPVRVGDFTVALDGPAAVGAVLQGGLFTHALSPRLNGAVRTPYLGGISEPHLSLETCGGDFSAERIVIDNAFLSERQTYIARRDPAWSALSTFPELAGRRVYVELATKSSNPNFPPRVGLGGPCTEAQVADPRSWLGITRAVVHKEPGPPQDELTLFGSLFEGPAPRSRADVAGKYTSWFRAALERWRRDTATADDVRLINWLLDAGLLPNRSDDSAPTRVRDLVAAYRRTERLVLDPETVNGLADLDEGDDYRLNIRGEYDQLGPPVPRGYLGVFARDESSAAFRDARSGRLELAERVADASNPLTARVYVNRVWQWVFGTGLVATPDDFGRLGDPPSHPELLDFLARRFVANGWSTKDLVRELVLSAAFRQGSTAAPTARSVDPANRLLHHYPLRRLEAEEVRDAILASSGRLDRQFYGPTIDPHRPKEDPEKRLFSGPLDGKGRRSLYIKLTIMEPPKFLAAFNQPPPKIPTGRRDVTSVPAQALALLNNPFVLEQAHFWGQRVVADRSATVESRLAAMFRVALGRTPDDGEVRRWRDLVDDLARERGVPAAQLLASVPVWTDVAHTLFNTKEFLYLR